MWQDTQEDINSLVHSAEIPYFDIAYYAPPYNQHPYGSNYFMLNMLVTKEDIAIQDGVSGIAKEWNRSAYNKRAVAEEAFEKLISDTPAKILWYPIIMKVLFLCRSYKIF